MWCKFLKNKTKVGVGTESRGDNTKTRTLIGTVAYLSPELFLAY